MKVAEVLEVLSKCDPSAEMGVDLGDEIYSLEFIWEDKTGMVIFCCEAMTEEEEPSKDDKECVNKCEEKCNLHNEVAEI